MNILLRAIDRLGKNVDYYALDLSLPELHRTLAAVPHGTFNHVRCHGLHGTYDDGLAWLQLPENQQRAKCIMFLGSSIGNFERDDAAAFLKGFAAILKPTDLFLLAVDACQDSDRVYHAYNDREGVTEKFYRNGLSHANKILGQETFHQSDWDVIGQHNSALGRHEAFVSPRRDFDSNGFSFIRGERIRFENAHKYSISQLQQLFEDVGFSLKCSYTDTTGQYCELLHFLVIYHHGLNFLPISEYMLSVSFCAAFLNSEQYID